ncbi:hypothetical protein EDD37DRAFT_215603 [Exophiala viscosa]|uniref:uncharacterized protein n=1 Tax=Exophiala viscosa TaxID=2486360 RepID=UPI00219EB5BA|nr:hypothetical protein EDD37DRAFT_215603 [Exophiala viscosa]
MNTFPRVETTDIHESQGTKLNRNDLSAGNIYDSYMYYLLLLREHIPVEQVVLKLDSIFRRAGGAGTMFLGDEQTHCGRTIKVEEYLTTQRAILQDYAVLLQAQASDDPIAQRTPLPRLFPTCSVPRICTQCRALKLPCSLLAAENQVPCVRCVLEGHSCLLETSERRRRIVRNPARRAS